MNLLRILQHIFRYLMVHPVLWLYYKLCKLLRICFCYEDPEEEEASSSTYYQQGDLVVHERQSLQLCAVHTINNLLQLSRDDRDLPWLCGNYCSSRRVEPASREELDRIACDLTHAEEALLSVASSGGREKWWWWKLWKCSCCWNSNHRTLYYGNYSFETLEVALQHRRVSLEWFQPNSMNSQATTKLSTATTTTPLLKVSCDDALVIGFVINAVEGGSSWQNIPVVGKKCCEPSRHWYAISRVRRSTHISDEEGSEDRWKILDSDRSDEATLLQESELREYLQKLSNQDATIFRAVLNTKGH